MSHPANGNLLISNFKPTEHCASKTCPQPSVRAGKIVIYAQLGLSQIKLFATREAMNKLNSICCLEPICTQCVFTQNYTIYCIDAFESPLRRVMRRVMVCPSWTLQKILGL